jgi:hypothetical protein
MVSISVVVSVAPTSWMMIAVGMTSIRISPRP